MEVQHRSAIGGDLPHLVWTSRVAIQWTWRISGQNLGIKVGAILRPFSWAHSIIPFKESAHMTFSIWHSWQNSFHKFLLNFDTEYCNQLTEAMKTSPGTFRAMFQLEYVVHGYEEVHTVPVRVIAGVVRDSHNFHLMSWLQIPNTLYIGQGELPRLPDDPAGGVKASRQAGRTGRRDEWKGKDETHVF